jgi:hypothetical protein
MHKINGQVALHNLYQFTEIFIGVARTHARANKKDEARNWLRFFHNSSILKVLEAYQDPTGIFPVDLGKLKTELRALESECHPLDKSDNSTEFGEIRSNQKLLAFGISEILKRLPMPATTKKGKKS